MKVMKLALCDIGQTRIDTIKDAHAVLRSFHKPESELTLQDVVRAGKDANSDMLFLHRDDCPICKKVPANEIIHEIYRQKPTPKDALISAQNDGPSQYYI